MVEKDTDEIDGGVNVGISSDGNGDGRDSGSMSGNGIGDNKDDDGNDRSIININTNTDGTRTSNYNTKMKTLPLPLLPNDNDNDMDNNDNDSERSSTRSTAGITNANVNLNSNSPTSTASCSSASTASFSYNDNEDGDGNGDDVEVTAAGAVSEDGDQEEEGKGESPSPSGDNGNDNGTSDDIEEDTSASMQDSMETPTPAFTSSGLEPAPTEKSMLDMEHGSEHVHEHDKGGGVGGEGNSGGESAGIKSEDQEEHIHIPVNDTSREIKDIAVDGDGDGEKEKEKEKEAASSTESPLVAPQGPKDIDVSENASKDPTEDPIASETAAAKMEEDEKELQSVGSLDSDSDDKQASSSGGNGSSPDNPSQGSEPVPSSNPDPELATKEGSDVDTERCADADADADANANANATTKTTSTGNNLSSSIFTPVELEEEREDASSNSSSSSSSSSDEEQKIAAQMAAVALAATAKTSDLKSPAAAANYAKDISKAISPSVAVPVAAPVTAAQANANPTIVQIPPSDGDSSNSQQQQQQQNSGNNQPSSSSSSNPPSVRKRRNRRIPVHPLLVQKMIAQQYYESMKNARRRGGESDDDDHDDDEGSGDNDDMDNGGGDTEQVDIGLEESHSDITFGTSPYYRKMTTTTGGVASPSSSCALAPSTASPSALPLDIVPVMQQQMAKGQNFNFLKHLLLLNNHTCIVSEEDVALEQQQSQQQQSHSRQRSGSTGSESVGSGNSNSNSNSGDETKNDGQSCDNDPAGTGYTPEELEIATNAALLVMDTLQQMDKSYNYLLDLIQIHQNKNRSSSSMNANTNPSVDQETDASIGSDMDGYSKYDPNSSFSNLSFESTKVIPDLLPLCTSSEGDATALFFRACAPISTEAAESSAASTTVSADGNNGSGEVPTSASRSSTLPDIAESSGTTTEKEMIPPSPKTPNAGKKENKQQAITSPTTSARTVASSIMSSVFRRSRNKQQQQQPKQQRNDDETSSVASGGTSISSLTMSTLESIQQNVNDAANGLNAERSTRIGVDYNVTIMREMLGLTVENVLERTVVRTVLPNGAAKKAGTKVGSLVVKVGSVETANLTHFETIDELRQSQRPLKLVLRRISKDALRGAREEMGRLIRGGGFGVPSLSMDGNHSKESDDFTDDESQSRGDDSVHMDLYIKLIQDQWMEGTRRKLQANAMTKRDEALSKAGAKLAWVLSLLVIGLEREAIQSRAFCDDDFSFGSHLSDFDHSVKDYADAAKSVSKILHDYARKHFEREPKSSKTVYQAPPLNALHLKRKKQIAPPPHIQNKQRQAIPGASKRSIQNKGSGNGPSSLSPAENALLQIGDVLHRARSFLADPNSPPAALLRGEVIALLCDILDLDNEMTLSEEESASSSADRKPGLIDDLGSAGSLLKLIVLNCSMMRSSGCHDHDEDSHAAHAGNRFLAVVHRLAASRSISARVTACSLGPVLWGHLDFPHQLQLRGVITRALHDVEVIVRKSTATVLHEIAELVFDSRAVPWLVLMCERAMTDPEPQLRAAAMTLTFHLAEHLPNAFFGDASEGSRSIRGLPSRSDPTFAEVYLLQCKLLPVATRLAEDGTASVRLAVAAQCDRLAKAMGEHWHSVIIDLLQALLGDKDSRVRGEAAMCIPRLAESVLTIVANPSTVGNGNMFVLESLLPVALKLQKDPAPDVRMCLAAASGELLSYLVWLQHLAEESNPQEEPSNKEDSPSGQKRYIDDTLIPLLQNLLQDSDPEVTSAALRAVTNASRGHGRDRCENRKQRTFTEDDSVSLSSQSHHSYLMEKRDPVFRPVLSEGQVLRLVPTLSELSSSTQWRVRQSAVEIVPALLGCTHRLETRSEIAQLCVKLMGDPVDAVRKSAAECLCLGGSNLGSNPTDESTEAYEWLAAVVMPHLGACKDSANSKQRLLCLKMIEMVLVEVLRPNAASSGSKSVASKPSSSLSRKTLEMASSLCSDKVVNVRLNVGRTYGNVMNSCTLSAEDLEYVISVLEGQMAEEMSRSGGGDSDVLYFAKKSISLAKERLDQCCNLNDGFS